MMSKPISFILNHIFHCWQVHVHCYSSDGTLFSSSLQKMELYPDTQFFSSSVIADYYARCEKYGHPILIRDSAPIQLCAFLDDDRYMYLIGPYTDDFADTSMLRQFIKKNHLPEKDFYIPFIPTETFLTQLSLCCYILSDRQYSETELMDFLYSKKEIQFEKEMSLYKLDTQLQERQRITYEEELDWLTKIENGTIGHIDLNVPHMDLVNMIGLFSMDHMKQTEYMLVTAVALAIRAIIRGGVPPYEAYDLGDVSYQKLANCKTVPELYQVYDSSLQAMMQLSHTYRLRRSSNRYIEQCKNYIGKHIHQKFTLEDIANELQISPSYLSRLFTKEEGINVSKYITLQRLHAAENLLKYSSVTIGDIAEWLCFNSQSHFGQCFKNVYGVTPTEYRNTSDGFMKKKVP